jgi:hypothetical protein
VFVVCCMLHNRGGEIFTKNKISSKCYFDVRKL